MKNRNIHISALKPGVVLSQILIIILLITPPLSSHAENKPITNQIVFASVLPKNSFRVRWYELIYSEAFHRLGIPFEITSYPMKRGPHMVNLGILDGEPGRVADFNSVYQNLIRIDVKMWSVKFSAYTTDKTLKLDSWESLRNKNLWVDCRRGIKKCGDMLPKVVDAKKLGVANEDIFGLRKLWKNRIDVYISLESLITPLLQTESFPGVTIYKAGTLGEYDIYPFMHKKHAVLVKKLETVLKQMQQEGLFEQYSKLAAAG